MNGIGEQCSKWLFGMEDSIPVGIIKTQAAYNGLTKLGNCRNKTPVVRPAKCNKFATVHKKVIHYTNISTDINTLKKEVTLYKYLK